MVFLGGFRASFFYALNYFSCSPQKKWGRFAFLKQFRNRIFIEYPFNLDVMNKYRLT